MNYYKYINEIQEPQFSLINCVNCLSQSIGTGFNKNSGISKTSIEALSIPPVSLTVVSGFAVFLVLG